MNFFEFATQESVKMCPNILASKIFRIQELTLKLFGNQLTRT